MTIVHPWNIVAMNNKRK